ncbi:MAG: T9SS type A sorting domain-containing protein, partial [Saprospiraceae bacterium]
DFGTAGTGKLYYCDDIMMVAAPVLAKPDLPITFEDTVTINHDIVGFGGNNSWMVVDPTDNTNTVLQSTKEAGSQTWAGTTMGNSGLAMAIPITATNTKMTVRVWSPDANTPVLLKIEDTSNGAVSVETLVSTTVAGQWDTLEFDFMNNAANTPALDLTKTYDKVSIFFDFGTAGTGKTYYCDDVMMGTLISTNQLIVDERLFTLQPNLANNYTNIRFDKNMAIQQASVNVYNALGQHVSNVVVENTDTYRMNTSNLPSGMYYVNVQVGNKMATKRLVIVR